MILFHCEHESICLDNMSVIPLRRSQTVAIIGTLKSVLSHLGLKLYIEVTELLSDSVHFKYYFKICAYDFLLAGNVRERKQATSSVTHCHNMMPSCYP